MTADTPASRPSAPPSDPTPICAKCGKGPDTDLHRFPAMGHPFEPVISAADMDRVWNDREPGRSGDGDPTPPDVQTAILEYGDAMMALGSWTPEHAESWATLQQRANARYDALVARFTEVADELFAANITIHDTAVDTTAFAAALASQRAVRARAEQDAARYRELRRLLFEDMEEVERLRCLSPSRVDAYLSIPKLAPAGQPEAVSRDA